MSQKLSNQDIVALVSEKTGKSRKEVSLFLKEFQNVIESGLENDRIVKINGLGTFKAVWVEPRKSVNVQTGESIEIPGRFKLNYLPDKDVRLIINKPFEHLEVVPLDDSLVASKSNDVAEDNSLSKLSIQAQGLKAVIDEIQDSQLPSETVESPAEELVSLPIDDTVKPIIEQKSEDRKADTSTQVTNPFIGKEFVSSSVPIAL